MPRIEDLARPGETREQTAERLCRDGGYASLESGAAEHPAACAWSELRRGDEPTGVEVYAEAFLADGASVGFTLILTPREFGAAMKAAAEEALRVAREAAVS